MLAGRGLSEVEDELIDHAHLSTDEKAAFVAVASAGESSRVATPSYATARA
jgi:hypothetical protein